MGKKAKKRKFFSGKRAKNKGRLISGKIPVPNCCKFHIKYRLKFCTFLKKFNSNDVFRLASSDEVKWPAKAAFKIFVSF